MKRRQALRLISRLSDQASWIVADGARAGTYADVLRGHVAAIDELARNHDHMVYADEKRNVKARCARVDSSIG